MKNRLGVFAAIVCAIACCVALMGCKGGSTESAEEFIGTWNLQSVSTEADDMKVSASDISLMQSFGYTVTLVLNGDGSASLDMFGEVAECEWSAKDENAAVLTVNGEKVDLAIDEKGVLKMSQGGSDSILFERNDPAAKAEDGTQPADGSAESSGASSDSVSESGDAEQEGSASTTGGESGDTASGPASDSGDSAGTASGDAASSETSGGADNSEPSGDATTDAGATADGASSGESA